MKKIKLTCAHAIIKHLIAQKILIDGKKEQLFAGAFGIFGPVSYTHLTLPTICSV